MRDKDAVNALYREFVFYRNALHSFTFEGESGMNQMQGIMARLRAELITEIAGCAVSGRTDYQQADTDLPKANALECRLANGSKLMVRPSGTEPKIKVYISAVAASAEQADAINAALAAAAESWMNGYTNRFP